jgi:hypothetical protein
VKGADDKAEAAAVSQAAETAGGAAATATGHHGAARALDAGGRVRGVGMPFPPSENYASEKLTEAVHALATGVGPLQARLGDAALFLIRLRPDDFPEDLRRMFAGVIDDLTFDQAQGDEGQIAATMKNTSDEDARVLAGRIFSLFVEMSRRA